MRLLASASVVVGALALAVVSAAASPSPSPAGTRAYFEVRLAGTMKAGSDSTSSAGQINTKVALAYRWSETLDAAFAVSTGKLLARSGTVAGKGSVGIDVLDSRSFGENHSLSCEMGLRPDAKRIRTREPLRLSFDPARRSAAVGSLMPVDLVDAVYSGPSQLNGLAPPCFSSSPYNWTAALAIPLQQNPRVAPFQPLSCTLGRVGSSCEQPFSFRMSWPGASGSSSLSVTASLTAKRLTRAPAALAQKPGR